MWFELRDLSNCSDDFRSAEMDTDLKPQKNVV